MNKISEMWNVELILFNRLLIISKLMILSFLCSFAQMQPSKAEAKSAIKGAAEPWLYIVIKLYKDFRHYTETLVLI